ncbi:Virginiamycin B lyase [Nocardioides aquaticus]|uniref:Virginiamycin B lyase n=1 Tax=Nocardioides aquaticus TaxID=160826 RepID=A0ABX8ENH6_9ACTN|nr:ScyD/ScyE family protein [Nocardioides aquaticus]QVT81380.1 Virginiamycin B lyase [Nocardioides aquaticus]
MSRSRRTILTAGAALAVVMAGASGPGGAQASHSPGSGGPPQTVVDLEGPRGVDALGHGRTLVTEADGTFSMVVERRGEEPYTAELGRLRTDFAPAVAFGRGGTVYLLTGSAAPPEQAAMDKLSGEEPQRVPSAGATLFRWRLGWARPRPVADIGAYQQTDPDPADLEDAPEESNPFGLAALRSGAVLVADAAGNDLLRVRRNGEVETVARLLPRTVEVPAGLPDVPPEEGGPLPPAGTPLPSEGVATSVTVGPDGAWYVGELRGFPATPGTSQVWRVEPGSTDATCDPSHPRRGACTRFADGLTSVVDLGASRRHLYAAELSEQSWLQVELGVPGAEVGAVTRWDRRGAPAGELAPGELVLPGGVDADHGVYVTGPVFGPGALLRFG